MSVVPDVWCYPFVQHPSLKLQKSHAPLNGCQELVRRIAHCHHYKVPRMLYSRFIDACCGNDILLLVAVCLLASRQQYLFDKCLLLYVQS